MTRTLLGTLLCLLAGLATAAAQFHTDGRYVVDAHNQRVKLAAVNWYGAEEQDFVVAGLEFAPLPDIAHRIRSMGFNTVRLPWSNQMFETNPLIATDRLAANPELQGLLALDVFDAVIQALAAEGLLVILDNHTSTADWCCSNADGNGFWYTAAYPETSWIADWQAMAQRYAQQPAVIGVDLRNEPRGPTWSDWHSAAQRAGNAILALNPNLLIIVEGVNYASDLTGVAAAPVSLTIDQRLVYSVHDYSWFHTGLSSYAALKAQLDTRWGYLLGQSVPVWVGEFGTCHTSASCVASSLITDSGFWFAAFTRYLQERDADWCYWAVNGTQARGTGRTVGAAETFGILNTAWNGPASPSLLNALQAVSTPTATPAIAAGGIVNAATFAAGVPLAPGSLATLFGANLTPVTAGAEGLPLPFELGGGSIQMGNVAVPLLFASPQQVNVQIPWEADSATPLTMRAVVGSLASSEEPLKIAPVSPVIFVAPGGGNYGAILIANTALLARPSSPVHPGQFISIFCTGLGRVDHPPPAGEAAPSLSVTLLTPAVRIGTAELPAQFSGLAPGFAGVYQVNVQVPLTTPASDSVPVSILIGGTQSNIVNIAVQ